MFTRMLPRSHRLLTLVMGLALCSVGLLHARPTHADMEWCWDDPVVSINGQQTQLVVGVQSAAAGVVANIVVYVPAGISTSIIVPPSTTPFQETLTFESRGNYSGHGPIPISVKTTFSGPGGLSTAIRATFASGSTELKTGNSNSTLVVNFKE